MSEMNRAHSRESGQVLIMMSIALVALLGILGLAVDFGWAFFVRKAAQGAADAAALAAAQSALAATGDPIAVGYTYAGLNDFIDKKEGSKVTITSGLGNFTYKDEFEVTRTISAESWYTATIQQSIPQLFSVVLGHPTGVSGARATAAVVSVEILGSLILLNHEDDCVAMDIGGKVLCGVDLNASGNSVVIAKDGIQMSSQLTGASSTDPHAGQLSGDAKVAKPTAFTMIRGVGEANVSNVPGGDRFNYWQEPWTNGGAGEGFMDPMRNLQPHQPPAPPSGMWVNPVASSGGTLVDATNYLTEGPGKNCTLHGGTDAKPLILQPGSYVCASGNPIIISGSVVFGAAKLGTDPGANLGSEQSGTFGNYVFFGGVKSDNSTKATFNPGRYVMAGTSSGVLLDFSSGQPIATDNGPLPSADGTPAPAVNAGEILILTDPKYPGLDTSRVEAQYPGVISKLTLGSSVFKTGNNSTSEINLHGLNKSDPTNNGIPDNLQKFDGVAVWQDQRNSVTRYYDSGGNFLPECVTGAASGCENLPKDSLSPKLEIAASPQVHIYGVIYQPRGAWTLLSGGSNYSGAMRIITGAIDFQGGADLNLGTVGAKLYVQTVALIR